MPYKETVTPSTLGLLTRLMGDPELQDFVLVGGISLALQIGHRVSVDLDLFSVSSFKEAALNQYLIDQYQFETEFLARSTVKGEIVGVQIDCLSHAYQNKYKTMNVLMPVKALTFFEEINFNEPIKMLSSEKFNWKKIEKRLYETLKKSNTLFSRL